MLIFKIKKIIKKELRNTMSQNILNNLTLMNTDDELLCDIDISGCFDKFAQAKCRNCSFQIRASQSRVHELMWGQIKIIGGRGRRPIWDSF